MTNKYKYQYLVLLLSMVIGFCIGLKIMADRKDKQIQDLSIEHRKQIRKEINLSRQRIDTLNYKILELDDKSKHDSIKIIDLLKSVKKREVELQKREEIIKTMNSDEMHNYIIDRYSK